MFRQILDEHKARFEPWRALIVLDDKVVRRYVMAWSPLLVRRVNDWPDGESMADLWACVEVNYHALGEVTGDGQPDVMGRFRQCQRMNLIYPDGSVEREVVKILTGKADEAKRYADS